MKGKEKDLFEAPDDEMIEQIAQKYTILTDREKERMFSMSTKDQTAKSSDALFEGAEVSGVDVYKRPVWHKYAAVAASLLLIAGGIGGALKISRHISISGRQQQTAGSDISDTEFDGTCSGFIPDAGYETTPFSNSVAKELVEKERAVRALTVLPLPDSYGEHTTKLTVNSSYGSTYDIYYIKLTGTGLGSPETPEELKGILDAAYTPERAEKYFRSYYGGDITEKIDSKTATPEDYLYYITYNGSLYCEDTVIEDYGFLTATGDDVSVYGELLSDTEMLVHWRHLVDEAGYIDETLHAVSSDDSGEWRIDDIVSGRDYYGCPTDEEALAIAKELFVGEADVLNAMHGSGVEVDMNDTFSMTFNQFEDINENVTIEYAKVTDSRFSSAHELIRYLSSTYMLQPDFEVLDLSSYNDGFVVKTAADYPFIDIKNGIYNVQMVYIERFGKLYKLITDFRNTLSIAPYFINDPECMNVEVLNGNCILVSVDDDTTQSYYGLYPSYVYFNAVGKFTIERVDYGEWRISHFNLY